MPRMRMGGSIVAIGVGAGAAAMRGTKHLPGDLIFAIEWRNKTHTYTGSFQ